MKKLGVIAAPGWFDPTLNEFSVRHGDELAVTQTILFPVGFDYSFEAIKRSKPFLETAARQLAEAGVEMIIQVGPAFAYMLGESPAGARALQTELSEACGVPVILNGVAVLDALDDLKAVNLAVACPYYAEDWKVEITEFLERSEFQIKAFQTFVEQGVFATQKEVTDRAYQFSEDEILKSLRLTCAASEGVDAVMVGGSGIRTYPWHRRMEKELNLPIVSSDYALYQRVVRDMHLTAI